MTGVIHPVYSGCMTPTQTNTTGTYYAIVSAPDQTGEEFDATVEYLDSLHAGSVKTAVKHLPTTPPEYISVMPSQTGAAVVYVDIPQSTHTRYAPMTPYEARQLAGALIAAADRAEA